MSLASQIAALAGRIANEFNAVRSEIASLPAGSMATGTSFPESAQMGEMFFMSDTKVAYVYSGELWIAMTPVTVIDGGDAELTLADTVDGGDA